MKEHFLKFQSRFRAVWMMQQDKNLLSVHKITKTKLGPKSITKSKSNGRKDAISPLAARGVEIKRNVAKRSQASSLPQRKLDIDKELDSWKMEEDSE